jgi:hypothetical protein
MGRPSSNSLERRDLVECQVKATCISPNVKANPIDPGRRRTDNGNLVHRGQLRGEAKGSKSGPASRTSTAIAGYLERDIYRTGTDLSEATLRTTKVETLAGAHYWRA